MGFSERDMVGHSGPAPGQRAAGEITEAHRRKAHNVWIQIQAGLNIGTDDPRPFIACALAEAEQREREAIAEAADQEAAANEAAAEANDTPQLFDCAEALRHFARLVRARGARP